MRLYHLAFLAALPCLLVPALLSAQNTGSVKIDSPFRPPVQFTDETTPPQIPADVPDDRRVAVRAGAAAEININAARNFNIGLRAVYFAIGSAGWLLGPLGLVAGTVLVTSMTLRREFTSASRQAVKAAATSSAEPGRTSTAARPR